MKRYIISIFIIIITLYWQSQNLYSSEQNNKLVTEEGETIILKGLKYDDIPMKWLIDPSSQYIVVSVLKDKSIKFFNYKGEFVRSISRSNNQDAELARPTGFDIDSKGNIYIADDMVGKTFVFNKDGKLVKTYSDPFGSALQDILIYKNKLYIIYSGLQQTYLITQRDFNYKKLKLFHLLEGKFTYYVEQTFASIDKNGYIYVVTSAKCKVTKYSPAGKVIKIFEPSSTCLDTTLYKAPKDIQRDEEIEKVKIINEGEVTGKLEEWFSSFTFTEGIWVWDNYVMVLFANKQGKSLILDIYSTDGTFLKSITFFNEYPVAISNNGYFYFMQECKNRSDDITLIKRKILFPKH